MARDATVIAIPNLQNIMNYTPALAQALADYGNVAVHLKLPIAFGTADAATLCTVPVGLKLRVVTAYWEVTTSFTGGASSAIGVSSDDADYATKGDILGGAAGDVAAGLLSTGRVYKGGTVGTKMTATLPATAVVVVGSGKLIRFDRITSAFTAGAGFVHIDGFLVD